MLGLACEHAQSCHKEHQIARLSSYYIALGVVKFSDRFSKLLEILLLKFNMSLWASDITKQLLAESIYIRAGRCFVPSG